MCNGHSQHIWRQAGGWQRGQAAYVKAGEVRDNGAEPLADGLLCEFNLPHVKGPDAADLVPGVDHCRGFALRRRGGGCEAGGGGGRETEQ